MSLFYLAYGSNLHPLRLRDRAPSCLPCGIAALPGYVLRFHKRGRDGSGKADIVRSGKESDVVMGVIYQLAADEKKGIDEAEVGYDTKRLIVNQGGAQKEVFTYQSRPEWIDDRLRPFFWYRELILLGSRYHGLEAGYREQLEATPAIEDPDPERRAHHARLISRLKAGL